MSFIQQPTQGLRTGWRGAAAWLLGACPRWRRPSPLAPPLLRPGRLQSSIVSVTRPLAEAAVPASKLEVSQEGATPETPSTGAGAALHDALQGKCHYLTVVRVCVLVDFRLIDFRAGAAVPLEGGPPAGVSASSHATLRAGDACCGRFTCCTCRRCRGGGPTSSATSATSRSSMQTTTPRWTGPSPWAPTPPRSGRTRGARSARRSSPAAPCATSRRCARGGLRGPHSLSP